MFTYSVMVINIETHNWLVWRDKRVQRAYPWTGHLHQISTLQSSEIIAEEEPERLQEPEGRTIIRKQSFPENSHEATAIMTACTSPMWTQTRQNPSINVESEKETQPCLWICWQLMISGWARQPLIRTGCLVGQPGSSRRTSSSWHLSTESLRLCGLTLHIIEGLERWLNS